MRLLGIGKESFGLVRPSLMSDVDMVDWSYLAVLNREVYEAKMEDLCESLENGLKFINRLQDKGIGAEAKRGRGGFRRGSAGSQARR